MSTEYALFSTICCIFTYIWKNMLPNKLYQKCVLHILLLHLFDDVWEHYSHVLQWKQNLRLSSKQPDSIGLIKLGTGRILFMSQIASVH